ncbi:spore coat protein [Litchfieldia alkalitelluris]|uniref:spore coat protein n=1 Tax=Litchfieldia alkalitelluris TaxID=304268 RepID=UPI0019585538|nr:spore coat protein [Litchfieldia alkalitelluris]
MMNQQLGAHELMEIHEVLCDTIDGINQFQLYLPHCQDQQLQNILQNQINFMMNEYNAMVGMLGNKTSGANLGSINTRSNFSPTYGLDNPSSNQPNTSMTQMDDRDVASGMLGCAKSSAVLRMHASLECADPEIRNSMIQGSKNCADQAYETWQYMNSKGYYQVPTLKDTTAQTFAGMYQPASGMMNQNQMNMNQDYPVQIQQQQMNPNQMNQNF